MLIACLGYLIQNPHKYPIHGLFGEPMPEVIAHRGKMRRFLLQGITEKPAIAIVCADFFRCPPQRGKAVQMLDQHHLEQHHRVDAGAPIILTVQGFYHFVEPVKTYRRIYFSQQMVSRHQLVYDYELYQISIHFPTFQHLSSPLSILPYLSEKAQLQPDFFDMLSCRGVDLPGSFFAVSRRLDSCRKMPEGDLPSGIACIRQKSAAFSQIRFLHPAVRQ